jgi:hypothetical protein
MSNQDNENKEHLETDFPLSGGKEPDFDVPRWVFVAFFAMIALVVAATLHSRGVF